MCGIVAVVRKRDQNVSEKDLLPLLNQIRHRGPDQTGSIIQYGSALGMVRLSIIDVDCTSVSPLIFYDHSSSKPKACLCFNGEIFNYIELRDELISLGHKFETQSDTEVLLASYVQWGEECLDKLNGMFAFIIADYERDLLFAARDIAGEKPLYYAETNDELIFASEIKAILARIGVPEVNFTDEYRAFEYMTGAETLFRGIYSVLPAEKILVHGLRGSGMSKKCSCYWEIDSHRMDINPKHALDIFDELLHDSVAIRLRSDLPLGLYLSGGVDSALLAYLARPSIVFSAQFQEGKNYDELQYAKLVSDEIKAQHVVVRPTEEQFDASLDRVLYHLDMPTGSFSAFPLFKLAEAASRHVKVVISGEGADELFSGYSRYLILALEEQVYRIPELRSYQPLIRNYFGSTLQRFARLLNRGTVSDKVVERVIAPYFCQFSDVRHAMGYTEFKLMLVTLLQMADRMAAAFGLESRCPFLDKRIISFAFSIPGNLKIRRNTTKFIVRELAKRYIPKEISARKEKYGLIAPINIWKGFSGQRGEFDRKSYNALCFDRWQKIFFAQHRESIVGCS